MHPTEQSFSEMISSCFARLGAEVDKQVVHDAILRVLAETDPFLSFALERTGLPTQTIVSVFHGIRVIVRIGFPIPGCLSFFSDLDLAKTIILDHDMGWGSSGPRYGRHEQNDTIRAVFARLAEELPSQHARLELLDALGREKDAPPVLDVWDLVSIPDDHAIEDTCRSLMT
ncbi:hypothetical protein GU927_005340 [Rhodobacteraceae bacterium HSP-20]|uniref:Uncharacterized protein n=1 Tax=Paragemmobacter amnigenus TaxID=2852097 RepID=A0ABS6J0J1_9RHOB|nr:hypothetical protein [Rhodobacter amnigenus]MBU9697268.1 hypothetical protein [Rhodobacter amnigenus]MBV4388495.1 hypothetical protein [Rhodobacter amnigenus]